MFQKFNTLTSISLRIWYGVFGEFTTQPQAKLETRHIQCVVPVLTPLRPPSPAGWTSKTASFTTGIAANALSAAPTPPLPSPSPPRPPPPLDRPPAAPLLCDASPQPSSIFLADASPRSARSRSVDTPLERRREA